MKLLQRHYIALFILILLFSTPGLLAYLFFHHPEWLGAARTNKGVLLQPPAQFPSLSEKKKWHLILWQPKGCQQQCLQHLDKLARIRLALGRRSYQVQTLLVLNKQAEPLDQTVMNTIKENDIHIVHLSQNDKPSVFSTNPQVFIGNPNDFLILSYLDKAKPDDIYHDLKKLLKKE